MALHSTVFWLRKFANVIIIFGAIMFSLSSNWSDKTILLSSSAKQDQRIFLSMNIFSYLYFICGKKVSFFRKKNDAV